MAGTDAPRRALLDGALPLAALLSVALFVGAPATFAVATLYLVFAAGIASGGADRPGEPELAWRLYALGTGGLALLVPIIGFVPALKPVAALPLLAIAAGFAVHVRIKARHGVCRIGVLSACGRRAHDARVGRALELMVSVLAAATVVSGPWSAALYAVAGWLLTAAAVAERPEPRADGVPSHATSIAT
jgi:hypothetical protein